MKFLTMMFAIILVPLISRAITLQPGEAVYCTSLEPSGKVILLDIWTEDGLLMITAAGQAPYNGFHEKASANKTGDVYSGEDFTLTLDRTNSPAPGWVLGTLRHPDVGQQTFSCLAR